MNINYTARNTRLTPDIKKYCEKRLQSIEKLLEYPVEASLILSVEKYRHKVEINVKIKGTTLHAVGETKDMFISLGAAFDHVEKRVKKEREKLREKKRKVKSREASALPSEREEAQKRIIHSRDYSLKPFSVEEAIHQMESNKRDIFMFRKFDSEKWAVLYRRKDGHFGLVEPEG